MRLWSGLKSVASSAVLAIVILANGACGGGGGGAADPTQVIALSSIAEGGSSPSFTAFLLEHTPLQSDTGIVLLHGRGGNQDSAVVSELRRDLHNRGYTTLSIQEPVLRRRSANMWQISMH